MKKRRTAIIAFLLLAVCTLSIGYAALSDYLVVTGSVEANKAPNLDFDADVYFTEATLTMHKADESTFTPTEGIVSTATLSDPDTVTITANGFGSQGDHAIIDLTIKNDNAYAVKVSLDTAKSILPDAGDDFTIEIVSDLTDAVAANGGTKTVQVKITLNTAPSGTVLTETFTIQLLAEQVTQ